jgi:hypothetical protein
MECYRFEKIFFEKGLFDVDRTYIIHLEGNGRLDNIYKQLEEFHPSKEVYILFNKGYKKCHKNLEEQKSTLDLIDAFMTIFKDAKDLDNILILEDDFFFDKDVKEVNIDQFINDKKDESFVYYLGTVPYLTIPSLTKHHITLLSTGTHACIYSKKMRKETLENKVTNDWDVYINFNHRRYMYHKPLCYQLFPETENSKEWGFGSSILRQVFKWNGLDQSEKGYQHFYLFSKFLFIILIIIFIYVIHILLSRHFLYFIK